MIETLTLQIPVWVSWIPAALGLYLVIGMIFGCPYCFTPDLAWPATLFLGITVPIIYNLGLWPESWRTYCNQCGEEIPPMESSWRSSEYEGRYCSYDCLEEKKDEEGG